MIRISALNDSSDDESRSASKVKSSTKEAQESEALALYNQALSLLRQGDEDGARNTFLKLLEVQLVKEAAPLTSEDEGLVHPGMVLKYSTYKNLGSMAAQHEQYDTAMKFYLEAVMVDSSDVTVWYKVGSIALKIQKYQLARHAFEQGLECQPRHWPCLDNVITVLYALNNYEACLVYISRALERDPGYIKGISFMEKIFDEQPWLRRDMTECFSRCDQSILTAEVDQEEADEYISEAMDMRAKKLQLCRRPSPPVLTFTRPLEAYTWEKLAASLIALYDHISTAPPPISFACKVDISAYTSLDAIKKILPDPATSDLLASESPGGSTRNETPILILEEQMSVTVEDTIATPSHEQTINQGMESISMEKEPAKRGPKKRRQHADETTKRRSARVRNTGKKPADDQINLQDLFMTFLPSSLIQVQGDGEGTESSQEELMDTSLTDMNQREAQAPTDSNEQNTSDDVFITATEQDSVLNFMKSHQSNSGIIDLLNEFLISLANECNMRWPGEVANMYAAVYDRFRKHFTYPGYLCKDVPDERLRNMGLMCLVQSELKVDKWLRMKTKSTPGPSPRRAAHGAAGLGANFPGTYFKDDLIYLVGLSQCQDVLDDLWSEFVIRVFWMQARFRMLDGSMEEAVASFDRTTKYLTLAEKEAGGCITSIRLPHCRLDNLVTLEDVKLQLDSLHRCQSQDKMQDLHDCGQYEKVILLLLQTFSQNPDKPKVLEIETQERHAQLVLLMVSLLKIKDYKRGLIWGEVSLNEAIQKFTNAPTCSVREEWANTMTQILDSLEKCVSGDKTIVKSLSSRSLVRLTQNLMSIMELAQDVPDGAPDMGIPSLTPWILLYKLVERQATERNQQEEDKEQILVNMPPTLTLLTVAHEQLSRRSWCTNSDGALLLFTIEEVQAELQRAVMMECTHPLRADLEHMLEQCFYCLYGHPHRRKAKHLQDHNCKQVSLTWERAIHVFEYFKPKSMPEYDSYKTSTVSGELESLLRRISALVPQSLKPSLAVEQVTGYIEGTTNQPPAAPGGATSELPVLKELHYLLADYYFKNKEQAKAIKFYLQDLCVCPTRFDSWAGMALARASRLEQKLNTYELKSEGKTEGSIWKHAIASLRCFKRALDLDSSNSKLWIEYGALAYQLHTHASRQLKQLKGENLLRKQTLYPLSEEALEEAKSNRMEMLRIAGNCYRKASECEAEDHEEEWLHHYMLGKVAEKMGRHPTEYLQHYTQALHFLHEDRARYPRRITYIYSPPHLAVETLEVYYRIHISVLKNLILDPGNAPYELFEKCLQEVADGPFVNCQEKDKKVKERDSSLSVDENSSSNVFSPITTSAPGSFPTMTAATNTKGKRPCHVTRMDHTYSKQRSLDSSGRSDPESSNEAGKEHGKDILGQPAQATVPSAYSMESLLSPMPKAMTSPYSMASLLSPMPKAMTSPSGVSATITSSSSSSQVQPGAAITAVASTAPTTVTSFSMATILHDMIKKELTDNSKVSEVSASSTCIDEGVAAAANLEGVHPGLKSVLPDTTLTESSPPVLSPQICVDSSTHTADPEEQLSSSSKLSSPHAVSSQSQDSQRSPSNTSVVKEDPIDIDLESSQSQSQSQSQIDISQTSSVDIQYYSDNCEKSKEEGELVIASEAKKEDSQKEDGEQIMKWPIEDTVAAQVTDSSSQDSTTAAELEKLKSEILFLNAGSIDMTGDIYSGSFDQVSSIKEEKSEKENSQEETKDEDVRSQNEALENLKSELQELSAAAGMQTPTYMGTASISTAKELKTEPVWQLDEVKTETSPTDIQWGMDIFQPSKTKETTQPTESTSTTTKAFGESPIKDASISPINVESLNTKEVAPSKNMESTEQESSMGMQVETSPRVPVVKTEVLEPSKPMQQSGTGMHGAAGMQPPALLGTAPNSTTKELCSCVETEPVCQLYEVKTESSPTDVQLGMNTLQPSMSKGTTEPTQSTSTNLVNTTKDFEEVPINNAEIPETKIEVLSTKEVEPSKNKDNNQQESSMEIQVEGSSGVPLDPYVSTANENKTDKSHQKCEGDTTQGSNLPRIKEVPQDGKSSPSSEVPISTVPEKTKNSRESGGKEHQEGKDQGKEEVSSTKSAPAETASEDITSKTPEELKAERKGRFKKIITQCMSALSLCLARFPHHYKSLYRLAFIYYHCKPFRDLTKARDMLMGDPNWQELEHMSSPGLFQDRKTTNFFQGLWRIPIEEIDRSGSFACHMLRSLQLMFKVLKQMRDAMTLFSVHGMLARTPDQGKKYLRDSDRVELARLALVYSISSLDELTKVKATEKRREGRIAYMMEVYRVWLYAVKLHTYSHDVNRLMRKAFAVCLKEEVKKEPSVLEQAIRFCQNHQALRTPMTPEGTRSSALSTPTSGRSQPLDLVVGGKGYLGRSLSSGAEPSQAQSASCKVTSADSSSEMLKGITPLPGTQVRPSPMAAKIIDTIKTIKPSTARPAVMSGQSRSPSAASVPGKETSPSLPTSNKGGSEQALRRPESGSTLKRRLSSSEAASPTLSKPTQGPAKKPTTKPVSSASLKSGYSMFQPAATSSPGRVAGMGLTREMSESILMQAHLAGCQREALVSQLALASQLGMPLAGMPYMYPGAAMNPTALWSALASNVAAQVLQEEVRNVGSSSGRKPAKTVFSSAASASKARASPSSSGQHSKTSPSSGTPTARQASSTEPPAKIPKMTPVPKSTSHLAAPTEKIPSAAIPSSQSVSTSKPTSVTGMLNNPAGAKILAKASELYRVRMSSALARRAQPHGSSGSRVASESFTLRAPGQMGTPRLPGPVSQVQGNKPADHSPVTQQRTSPTSLTQPLKRTSQMNTIKPVQRGNPQGSPTGQVRSSSHSSAASTFTSTAPHRSNQQGPQKLSMPPQAHHVSSASYPAQQRSSHTPTSTGQRPGSYMKAPPSSHMRAMIRPVQPSTQTQPMAHSRPVQPSSQAQPKQLARPVQPSSQAQPTTHSRPVQPSSQAQSKQLARPVQPSSQAQPKQVARPVQPSSQTQPKQLARPVQPSSQTQPTTHSRPVQPSSQAQPKQLARPVQPSSQAQPKQLARPVQPSSQAQPKQLARPVQPSSQAQPKQLARPVQPSSQAQPKQLARPVQPSSQAQPKQLARPVQPSSQAQPKQLARPVQPSSQAQPKQLAHPVQPSSHTQPTAHARSVDVPSSSLKNVQPLPGGYGRGKPSYPATLPTRQSSSDSEDCIIISSSQDSDSD